MTDLLRMSMFCDDASPASSHISDDNASPDQPTSPPIPYEERHPTSVSPDMVHEIFWSYMADNAKVDISTFHTTPPELIFGNVYLHPLYLHLVDSVRQLEEECVHRLEKACCDVVNSEPLKVESEQPHDLRTSKANEEENVKTEEDTKPCDLRTSAATVDKAGKVYKRLPYTYTGLAATAVYVSGKEGLTANEVHSHLSKYFVNIDVDTRRLRKNVARVFTKHKLFYRLAPLIARYGVRAEMVEECNKSFMRADSKADDDIKQSYPNTIAEQLNLPNLVSDLASGKRLNNSGVFSTKAQVATDSKPKPTKKRTSDGFTDDRKETRQKLSDGSVNSKTRSKLQMPDRPCFNDDDDDELILPGIEKLIASTSKCDHEQCDSEQQDPSKTLPSNSTAEKEFIRSPFTPVPVYQPWNVPTSSSYSLVTPSPSCHSLPTQNFMHHNREPLATMGQYFTPGVGPLLLDGFMNGHLMAINPYSPLYPNYQM